MEHMGLAILRFYDAFISCDGFPEPIQVKTPGAHHRYSWLLDAYSPGPLLCSLIIWLVVSTPLKDISQHIWMIIPNIITDKMNMLQTTNQFW